MTGILFTAVVATLLICALPNVVKFPLEWSKIVREYMSGWVMRREGGLWGKGGRGWRLLLGLGRGGGGGEGGREGTWLS